MVVTASLLMQSAYAVSCSGLAVWSSSAVYVDGNQIQHQNVAYTANWWTQGNNPATNNGGPGSGQPWTSQGNCDGGGSSSGGSSSGGTSSGGTSSGGTSSGGSSSGGSGGSCTSPQYIAGTQYSAGQKVQNIGNEYTCDIAGWCSSTAAWAYEPGVGTAWNSAWTQSGTCGGGSSSSSGGSSSGSTSSGGSSGGSSSGASSGGNLPRHALVGYWHNFDNGSGLIRIADVPNVWDVIVVAFADDAGNGNVQFNLDPGLNKAQFISDIAAKKAQGKVVVLSFGGQNGTITLNNSTNVANFVSSTAAIINEYGFSGIDWDIEGGIVVHGSPVLANTVTAIKQLRAQFGSNFYLSMAPEHPFVHGGFVAWGGIWGAYIPIINGLRNELNLLHVQLYNNGGLSTPYSTSSFAAGSVDMMVASAKMLIEGFQLAGSGGTFQGLRADQVALGLPSGPSSAGSGQATNNAIISALNCITRGTSCGSVSMNSNRQTFRGVMTWSINWDENDGRIFSGPIGNAVHNLP